MSPGPLFRLLEHTADMGIEARADSPAGVFVAMAQGLVSLMFGESIIRPVEQATVRLVADDAVELLVAWLNEIIYRCEAQRLAPSAFCITAWSDTGLEALILGEPFDPQRHAIERQAKAVTYHQAQLQQAPDGWFARVYVDL